MDVGEETLHHSLSSDTSVRLMRTRDRVRDLREVADGQDAVKFFGITEALLPSLERIYSIRTELFPVFRRRWNRQVHLAGMMRSCEKEAFYMFTDIPKYRHTREVCSPECMCYAA